MAFVGYENLTFLCFIILITRYYLPPKLRVGFTSFPEFRIKIHVGKFVAVNFSLLFQDSDDVKFICIKFRVLFGPLNKRSTDNTDYANF